MAFYRRSGREDASRRDSIRSVTSETSFDSAAVQKQLGDMMKMMQDQKQAVEACLTENKKLNDKVASLQESLDKLKEVSADTSTGGRKKIPVELSVRDHLNHTPYDVTEFAKTSLLYILQCAYLLVSKCEWIAKNIVSDLPIEVC